MPDDDLKEFNRMLDELAAKYSESEQEFLEAKLDGEFGFEFFKKVRKAERTRLLDELEPLFKAYEAHHRAVIHLLQNKEPITNSDLYSLSLAKIGEEIEKLKALREPTRKYHIEITKQRKMRCDDCGFIFPDDAKATEIMKHECKKKGEK